MNISIVVAADENGVIGKDNKLPWRLPADLKHFRELPLGKPVLMGRKTFESIGKPLSGRRNIVLTRAAGVTIEGCTVVNSLDDAIDAAGEADELMIIGGAEIYRESLELANRIYLTRVHTAVEGDTRFPDLDYDEWRETSIEEHAPDERNEHAYSFEVLERLE
nr:Dihydrofolate reductase [uncultured bacterium]